MKAKRRYYLEIVYAPASANNIDNNFIQVAWKRPRQSIFEIIESNFLSLYKNDSEKWQRHLYDDEMPGALPCRAKKHSSYRNKYMRPESFPYLKHQNVQRTLNYCIIGLVILLTARNCRRLVSITESISIPGRPTVIGSPMLRVSPGILGLNRRL